MSMSGLFSRAGEEHPHQTIVERSLRPTHSAGWRRLPRPVRLTRMLFCAGLLIAQQNTEASAQVPENTGASAQISDSRSVRAAVIAAAAGNLLDGFSTVVALRDDSIREANPLLGQNPTRIVVIKGLFTVPQVLAVKYLAGHGHPTAARWLGYSIGALGAGLAVHNFRVRSATD